MFSFLQHPFAKNSPKKHNVLLIETNGCHGEVIGGYVKYFQELGYNVYILISNTIKKENPFCRYDVKNIYSCNPKKFSKLLVAEYLNRYDHIFVMSSVNYDHGVQSVKTLYPDLAAHKSVYYIHHQIPYIYRFYRKTNTKHNIMLGKFKNTVFINPHLFGKYCIPQKSDKTIFVSVGGINPKRKNHTMLLSAITELDAMGLDFMVWIIGSGSLKHLQPNVRKHIQLLGHLDYKDMYNFVEKSHFFLPLLDDKNIKHNRYITTQVTGSAQLIYGFRKIPVIHKKFAKFYRFNSKNAVIYENLVNGMKSAILMKPSEYSQHITQLDDTATSIYNESLNNLKDILHA